MSRDTATLTRQVADILFPFRFSLAPSSGQYLRVQFHFGGLLSLAGISICLLILLGYNVGARKKFPHPGAILAVACSGIYGLIATAVIDLHDC